MDYMALKIILILSGAVCIYAERSHKLCVSFGCFDSSDTHISSTVDGDEVCYADFKKGVVVWDSKAPTTFHVDWAYGYAERFRSECKINSQLWKLDKTAQKNKEPPETIVYPMDDVMKEKENTLICLVDRFFPPSITIKWSKNDEEVAVEDPFIRSLPNPDGTFYVFSHLNFVPEEGDIYSCTVEHEALEEPQTRFWEVDTNERRIGPAVFCGLGLTLGVVGVVAGTFLFVKGSQYQGILDPHG